MGLGPYPALTLAKAPIEAQRRRAERVEGKDPLRVRVRELERPQARLDAARAVTFEQAAKASIAAREGTWKNEERRAQRPSTLEAYVCAVIGKLPVEAVDNRSVLDVLEHEVPAVVAADGRELRRGGKLWEALPDTAIRAHGRIEAVLDWARFNGYRQSDNSARWRGDLDFALATWL